MGGDDGRSDISSATLNQREQLIAQLHSDEVECLICCCVVRRDVATWNCSRCYNIFHLYCIKKWSQSDFQLHRNQFWHCPTCHIEIANAPNRYLCFCGKTVDPPYNRSLLPHSCGDPCLRHRTNYNPNCRHPCTEICHPGPCPRCQVLVNTYCRCGQSCLVEQCSSVTTNWSCEKPCGKTLGCGRHQCTKVCHSDDCPPCEEEIEQECYSHGVSRTIPCKDSVGTDHYSCGQVCHKLLSCGIHRCKEICHAGPCSEPCYLSPAKVTTCFCGKKTTEELGVERTRCTDPIPSCDLVCLKPLACGNGTHRCQKFCHDGECSCDLTTALVCKCRFKVSFVVACSDVIHGQEFKCNRVCGKRKSCMRHKCQVVCCTLVEHTCELICGRRLSCGLHECQEKCHSGKCPPCRIASFEDLSCRCGRTVITAPIPCGTKVPKCPHPCSREHPCDHPVMHRCHEDESCPPCVFLVTKRCMCGKSNVRNVQCFLEDVSCGAVCDKLLYCGRHRCRRLCHRDECSQGPCDQLCTAERAECGHPCGIPCHDQCPRSICRARITITCPCGRKRHPGICGIESTPVSPEESNDEPKQKSINEVIRLECDSECLRMAKLARFAQALQIEERVAQTSEPTPFEPEYTEQLKKLATELGSEHVNLVEERLSNFVRETMAFQMKYNSVQFNHVGWKKRQLIHDLAPYYGCSSHCAGKRDLRYVVVDTQFGFCRLPGKLLSKVISPEVKIPPPVRNTPANSLSQDGGVNGPNRSDQQGFGTDGTATSVPKMSFAAIARSKATDDDDK